MLSLPLMATQMTLVQLQELIHCRYYKTDSERGIAKTFLWLSEEYGELAHALGKFERGDPDMTNLREEFADVLAWLATVANITGIDLTEAIHEKYILDGGPKGEK